MKQPSRLLVIAALLWGVGAAGNALGANAAAGASDETGTWQTHKLTFHFFGFTSTYSCDGLADTLRVMLKTAGVGADAKVIPLCARGFGRPDRLATARLELRTLQPVSASHPTDADHGASAIAGAWRTVEFTWHKPYELRRGDCELVEQFADRILPLFATRNVQRNITCIPHQQSGSVFDLRFQVFALASDQKHSPQNPARKPPKLASG